jgi:hypothetical protein
LKPTATFTASRHEARPDSAAGQEFREEAKLLSRSSAGNEAHSSFRFSILNSSLLALAATVLTGS